MLFMDVLRAFRRIDCYFYIAMMTNDKDGNPTIERVRAN